MPLFLDLRTAIPLAGGLALCFYFRPILPMEVSIVLWGFFTFFYFLDARITVCNSELMGHEKNLVFPLLYKKFGQKISPVIQCVLEIVIMMFLTFLFTAKIGFLDASVTAFVFGLSHLSGYFSNRKLIGSLKPRWCTRMWQSPQSELLLVCEGKCLWSFRLAGIFFWLTNLIIRWHNNVLSQSNLALL